MSLPFHKLHGLGNDFIVVDGLANTLPSSVEEPVNVRRLCHRREGVGADGILLVLPPTTGAAHARMRVLNSDGSEPQMCGNGIRCVAKYLHDHVASLQDRELRIETGNGILTCRLMLDGSSVAGVRVAMGRPSLERESLPMIGSGRFVDKPLDLGERQLQMTAVSMGNPHVVAFIENDLDLEAMARELGPIAENHRAFPERTNAEFARLDVDGTIELWVWERGVGITQACGTGACATAVAAVVSGKTGSRRPVQVQLPGGILSIEVAHDLSNVWMMGPAVEVFSGALVV